MGRETDGGYSESGQFRQRRICVSASRHDRCFPQLLLGGEEKLTLGLRLSERGKMVADFQGDTILLEEEKGGRDERMKKIFVTVKETCQYVGIIGIALLSGLFLVIKMAVTEEKEETKDIEKASKK